MTRASCKRAGAMYTARAFEEQKHSQPSADPRVSRGYFRRAGVRFRVGDYQPRRHGTLHHERGDMLYNQAGESKFKPRCSRRTNAYLSRCTRV